jgi:hypothetical protein
VRPKNTQSYSVSGEGRVCFIDMRFLEEWDAAAIDGVMKEDEEKGGE